MRTLSALLLGLSLVAQAQTPAQRPAPAPAAGQLRFTLIVSRHGIRPPLAKPTNLNVSSIDVFSSSPWPVWEVPLGYLTPHGVQALTKMGHFLRLDLAASGLVPPAGCPAPSDIFIDSDTDERDVASSRATFQGFAPGCKLPAVITAVPGKIKDPLFTPVPGTFPAPSGEPAIHALRTALNSNPELELSPRANPELYLLAHILAPDPAHPAAESVLSQPIDIKPGDYGTATFGPLPAASALIEDLELEYVDGKPLSQVGWGRVDEATLYRLMPMRIRAFGHELRTPLYASDNASNLLAHILATLQQAASVTPAVESKDSKPAQPIGPAGTKLVYLAGHDSNLASLGGLLDLHWTADGTTDNTPPDSQLAFELWQRPGSSQLDLRILYRAQTLDQLRSAEDLSLAHPPDEVELTPTGCGAPPCPLAQFVAAAASRIDPAYVQPELAPAQVAP
jgi:4-phytase/acid phosphatase